MIILFAKPFDVSGEVTASSKIPLFGFGTIVLSSVTKFQEVGIFIEKSFHG
jgi:hypothetical protein